MADVLGRIRNVGKKPEDKFNQEVIQKTNKIWEYLRESRRRRSYEWFINDQFYDNNQYLKFNVASRRVQAQPVTKVLDRIIINLTKKYVRDVTNFLNTEHPAIGVRPGTQADDAYLRAKKETHQCEYWYDHLQLNRKGKLISKDACKKGVGWAKILWDNDALAPTVPFTFEGETRYNTYGQVMFERAEPYEIYVDPVAADLSVARYMIDAPVRTIGELQSNPLYENTDQVTADHKLSVDNMRQFELRQELSSGPDFGMGQGADDTVVVLEIFWRYFERTSNKWKMRVTTRTERGVVLRDEDWEMGDFPFEYFQTDVEPLILESKGIIHDIREPNRALNEIVSQIHENARIMGKINWRAPRGSNIDVITDESGQIIEYDLVPGGAPEHIQPSGLPAYVMQEPNMLMSFMQDISGIHSASNGKEPFAQASGDLVQALSEGDQTSLTQYRDNYNDFWARSYKKMLKTAKMNYKTVRNIPTRQLDPFGENIWVEIRPTDIDIEDTVTVNTGTNTPYSIGQKQQMYMNLWKEKAITDPTVLFKLLEMPDIDAAMGDDEADISRQLDEIKAMMDGKDPKTDTNLQPIISENHQVHIETLDKFAKTEAYKELSPKIQQHIQDHRQQHIQLSIQLAQIQQAMQVEPIKRSETLMIRPTNMGEITPIERTQFLGKFGIQSDAAQIQLRGGLYIQDPAQAEAQAQNEDIEMLQMRAVQISFGDNHQVHLETHSQIMGHPNFRLFPMAVQQLFEQHMKDHMQAMQAILASPGLVPNGSESMPNPATLPPQKEVQPPVQKGPNQMPKPGLSAGEQQAVNKEPLQQKTQPQAPQPAPPKQVQEKVMPITKPVEKITKAGKSLKKRASVNMK